MIETYIQKHMRKIGGPAKVVYYTERELALLLTDNEKLVDIYSTEQHKFIVVNIGSAKRARMLYGLLIRNLQLEEVTYQSSKQLFYIYYYDKLNWIPKVKDKIYENIISAFEVNKFEALKDEWDYPILFRATG